VLQIGRSLLRSHLVSLEFFIDIKSHYGPGVDSASNRNEYQKHFLGGKGGRCVGLTTLPPSCAIVTQSGNLNFLETSGPLQACNGSAFNGRQNLHNFWKYGLYYIVIDNIILNSVRQHNHFIAQGNYIGYMFRL